MKKIFLDTPGFGQWLVPSDWASRDSYVECIGGGSTGYFRSGGGGGGGAYSMTREPKLLPGSSVTYVVGGGAPTYDQPGGDTCFGASSLQNAFCSAQGGQSSVGIRWLYNDPFSTPVGAPTVAGASGGSASAGVGTVKYSGGAGGDGCYGNAGYRGGCGGGGAAGPNGNGAKGGSVFNNPGVPCGGGGGGGSNGGYPGANASTTVGAAGGNGRSGGGGGAQSSGSGSNGGGGGGGNYGTTGITGGAGGGDACFDSTHGAGGGGGGGGGGTFSTTDLGGAGVRGGLFGGGSGSPGCGNFEGDPQGQRPVPGAQGIIVITYQPNLATNWSCGGSANVNTSTSAGIVFSIASAWNAFGNANGASINNLDPSDIQCAWTASGNANGEASIDLGTFNVTVLLASSWAINAGATAVAVQTIGALQSTWSASVSGSGDVSAIFHGGSISAGIM